MEGTSPRSVSGIFGAGSFSLWPLPLAPSPLPPTVQSCSPTSMLLWRSLTSPTRASTATAPRFPDAGRPTHVSGQTGDLLVPEASFCACQSFRPRRAGGTRENAPSSNTFHVVDRIGSREFLLTRLGTWPAFSPDRRFTPSFTAGHARLGANMDRSSFTAVDFHHLLSAGLPHRQTSRHAPMRDGVSVSLAAGFAELEP
jgi:hypothetical protein